MATPRDTGTAPRLLAPPRPSGQVRRESGGGPSPAAWLPPEIRVQLSVCLRLPALRDRSGAKAAGTPAPPHGYASRYGYSSLFACASPPFGTGPARKRRGPQPRRMATPRDTGTAPAGAAACP